MVCLLLVLYKCLILENAQKIHFEGPEVKMPQFVKWEGTICPFKLEDIRKTFSGDFQAWILIY